MNNFRVSYVDLPSQYELIREEVLDVIDDVCRRGSYILRDEVDRFESLVAERMQVRHVIGLNSGADALLFSLRCLGIGKGDEVITVAHTFIATLSAIAKCGAQPVLVDIGEDFLMDVHKIEECISSRTRAIMPVHLNGEVCQMDVICKFAAEHDLLVIEDAAQAFGAYYGGRAAGSFGDAGCFSLHPMKIFSVYGDGGFVATDRDDLDERLRIERDHGQNRQRQVLKYGFSSRLDNLQAAVGLVKLRHFDTMVERRRQLARQYYAALKQIDFIELPPCPRDDMDSYNIFSSYVIRTPFQKPLQAYLAERGVETFVFWDPPLHKCSGLNLSSFDLPITERTAGQVLALPIHHALSDEDQGYVIESILSFSDKRTV